MPERYYKIVLQLSKLSLDAFNNNKFVFVLDEITAACPDITVIPEARNGFGLLQAIQRFGLTGITTTFNFLHLSIQEYLAVHYIIHNLSAEEELRIIKENFWSKTHFNIFSMYIALTNGQRAAFKNFLSGGNRLTTICDDFLFDQLHYFHLYHCFYKAGDDDVCKAIRQSKATSSKAIDLNSTMLAPFDVENIAVFLTSSFDESFNNEWNELDLLINALYKIMVFADFASWFMSLQ